MQQVTGKTNSHLWWRTAAPQTIAGVLVIGFLGSLLYDVLIKPGVSGTASYLFDYVAATSTLISDSVYQSAALDPRPVGPLVILVILLSAITAPLLYSIIPSIGKSSVTRVGEQIEHASGEEAEGLEAELAKLLRRRQVASTLAAIPLLLVTYMALMMHNRSVLIWRLSTNNLARVRSVISHEQYAALSAQFSSIDSASKYTEFKASLQEIALRGGVSLHPET